MADLAAEFGHPPWTRPVGVHFKPWGPRALPADARGRAAGPSGDGGAALGPRPRGREELAGGRAVEVAAGDVGGRVPAAGLNDEVAMEVAPVVFGSGKRYFGPVDARHPLDDPHVVIRGEGVLHLRYRVRK